MSAVDSGEVYVTCMLTRSHLPLDVATSRADCQSPFERIVYCITPGTVYFIVFYVIVCQNIFLKS